MIKLNYTIGIVTYRRPKQLQQCLDSISHQKYLPATVLIINNDHQKITYRHPQLNIKNISNPINNVATSRNIILKKTSSEYLAFIDDDCQLTPHWSEELLKCLSQNPQANFIQGSSLLANPSRLTQNSFQKIKQWLDEDMYHLDTKNLVLKTKAISRFSFDPQLPPFEDSDLGLQFKDKKVLGIHYQKLTVLHPEPTSISTIIKKEYGRGQTKSILDQKWGIVDNYQPHLGLQRMFTNPHQYILDLVFSLGYQKNKNQPNGNYIYLVNSIDHGANGERTQATFNFLKSHHYHPRIINSDQLFKSSLEYPFFRLLQSIVYRLNRHQLISRFFLFRLKLRGQILQRYFKKLSGSTIILQYSEDIFFLDKHRPYHLLIDAPLVFSEEVEYSHHLSSNVVEKIKRLEKQSLHFADFVSYHWHTYLDKNLSNGFILDWGCQKQSTTAHFNSLPKMVFVGGLNAPWVNLPLLTKIQKHSVCPLDIFSYEKSISRLKTLGFLTDPDQFASYQFGLLTCSNEPLRNRGFSAKQMLYHSYGLPVLVPEWRQDPSLESASIYYNATNFNQQIKKYSQEKFWQEKHLAALKIAQKYRWSKTLLPLLEKIKSFE